MTEKVRLRISKIFICDSLIHNFGIAIDKLNKWNLRKIAKDRYIAGSQKSDIEGIIASILVLINMMQEMSIVDAKNIMNEVSKRNEDCHNVYNKFMSQFEDMDLDDDEE